MEGLSLAAESDVTLINNIFYGNNASDGAGLGFYAESASDSATLYNEIYWSNTPNAIAVFAAGPVAAQYCNIEGGTGESWFGTGCIDSNPAFLNTASPQGVDGIYATLDDGLHLTVVSPSMNTGNNTFVPGTVTTDITGQNRIQNTTVDMGAYEGVAGTPTTPIITTTAVFLITSTSASSGGNVTSDGGATVTASGVCWSTSANPTTSDSKTRDSTGTGSFTSSMTGLSADTTYHVRAYATNNAGTAYGSDLNFTTSYASTIYVDSDGTCNGKTPCHSTIQTAIDASSTGSVSYLLQGGLTVDPLL